MTRIFRVKPAIALFVGALALSACTGGQDEYAGSLPPPSQESWELLPPTSEKLNDRVNYPKPAHNAVPSMADMSKRLHTLEEEVAVIKERMGIASQALSGGNVPHVATPVPAPVPAPIVAHQPMSKPAAKKAPAAATPAKAATGSAVLNGLRFAVEGGITKVIIDTGVSASFSTDLDNTEKLLIVELKGIKAGSGKSGKGKGLVSSYSVQSTNDGARIIYQLNGTSRIQSTGKLPPAGAYGHRILINLSLGK